MIKKSLKKTMVIALAGIILAGSLGWSKIPVRASVNGVNGCSHENKSPILTDPDTDNGDDPEYVSYSLEGHMERTLEYQYCIDCGHLLYAAYVYGDLEDHNFSEHKMIEDLHNGLYMHWIRCSECGYEDEVLSDDPTDPKM